MFIGHFGFALGAKTGKSGVSLGTLFLATQLIDLLWPTFLLLGIEHVKIQPGITKITPFNFIDYPYSHSLLMVILWGIVLGLTIAIFKRNYRGGLIVGLCVISHWFLDLIVHRPDLPLFPGSSELLGLGLWNSFPGTLIVEGVLFTAGVIYYLRVTKPRNKTGIYSFWALIGFLVLIYIGNLFGDPPPNVTALAWVGQLQWLFVLWGYWIDRNRDDEK